MAKKAAATNAAPTKYPIEALRTNCKQLFGVSEFVFEGATYGLSSGEYTVEETAKRIKDWLNKEAK